MRQVVGTKRDVRDVQEAVLVLVLFVYGAHERGSRWQHLVHEDEDGLLRRELNPLADHINELADGEVGRHQVLLLVDGRNVRLLDLLADNLECKVSKQLQVRVASAQADVRECGRCTSGEYARPRPCASRTGARP